MKKVCLELGQYDLAVLASAVSGRISEDTQLITKKLFDAISRDCSWISNDEVQEIENMITDIIIPDLKKLIEIIREIPPKPIRKNTKNER